MKPCAKNRKLITWLTLDALEVQQVRDLRAHIETCDGCRRYLEEISTVSKTLRAAVIRGDFQASESFHHRLSTTLRAASATGENRRRINEGGNLMAWLRRIPVGWRVALPGFGALALGILVLSTSVRRSGLPSTASVTTPASPAPDWDREMIPTIANYEHVANRSIDQLDELLTRQENRRLSSPPVYKASTLWTAVLSD